MPRNAADPPLPDAIGCIGLGIMGGPMATNLVRAGLDVSVFDVAPDRVEAVVAEGAFAANSAAEVAARSDIVVLSLPSAEIVDEVIQGADGLLSSARAGQVVIDTTTSYPAASQRAAAVLAEAGVDFLDAPVSGGVQGAIDGSLSIMVGGDASVLDRCRLVFDVLGAKLTHMGTEIGQGGYAKLANQIMVSLHLASVAEAFVFARRAGLDLEKLVPALEAGWANSTVLNVKAPKLLEDDYTPVGTATIQRKDLAYIERTCDDLGMDLPLSPLVGALYDRLIEAGGGDLDQMALIKVIAGEL